MSNNDDFMEHAETEPVPAPEQPKAEVSVPLKPNAIITEPYNFEKAGDGSMYYKIRLPSIPIKDFKALTDSFKTMNLDEKDPSINRWKDATTEAIDYYTPGGLYQNRFFDTDSEFHQGLRLEDGTLKSIGSVKFKKTEGEIKGELAILKISKMLGVGDVVNVMLPHSGMYVVVKPATEKELLDFWNSLFKEKMMLGRTTYGLTLTNFSNYINQRLFEFIQSHIQSVNYGDIDKAELGNYMLIHDYHILVWGFACTMFPDGYDYERACAAGPDKCTHVERLKLNLTKLFELDNSALTAFQKTILSEDRPRRHTVDVYRKFISEHTRVANSSFTLKNGIKVHLKVPTFNEYIADGKKWVDGINNTVESIILDSYEDTDDEKTKALNNYVKSSILRQFSHFIDYFELDDAVITDRDTINSLLETFSIDDDIRAEMTEEVFKYKAKSTIALIGIPEYDCPACKEKQGPEHLEEDRFKSVIPLDVVRLGFFFLTSRISRILEREV